MQIFNLILALATNHQVKEDELSEIRGFMKHSQRQIDQIRRRVVEEEKIPHHEKVFSIFEEHTEWISKEKAGVPVEFWLRVSILENQYYFILNHHVIQKKTDDQVAVSMVDCTTKISQFA